MKARTFSQRSQNNLRGVHPALVRVIERALQDGRLDFAVIEGLRTKQRQEQLVASGASKTMNSRHLDGHAVDLLPINPATGKGEFAWPLYDQLGEDVKEAARKEGVPIVWGGDWQTFKDGPHFELDRRVYPSGKHVPDDEPAKERSNVSQSTTVRATAVQVASAVGAGIPAVSALDGTAQIVLIGCLALVVISALWIFKERLIKWRMGDR